MIRQLATYPIAWWASFAVVAFAASSLGRFWGMIGGHVAIAILVAIADVTWVQAERHRPGWNGTPDQDAIFMFGVAIRIVLVNICLVPVSVAGWWFGRLRRSRTASPRNNI